MPRVRPIVEGHFVDLGTFEAPNLSARRVRAYVPRARPRRARHVEHAAPPRPTLVLFDGQNVFGDDGSHAGGWHADRVADRLATAPVIVAVDHGGQERIAELGAPASAKLGALVDLIVDRILPAAHARLPLQYGPGAHYVGGSSMGGLAALYTHFRRPEVFGGALCMSPSLWFGRRAIFDFVEREPNPYRSRVYLDAGAREGGGRLTTTVGDMAAHLRARGWHEGGADGALHDRRLLFRVDPKGTHHESHWGRRLPKALRFLFGP